VLAVVEIATNNNDKLKGNNEMKIIICFLYYRVVVDVYSFREMGDTKNNYSGSREITRENLLEGS
jgi:hypothetical protein